MESREWRMKARKDTQNDGEKEWQEGDGQKGTHLLQKVINKIKAIKKKKIF